jgi:hypothetical protein
MDLLDYKIEVYENTILKNEKESTGIKLKM